LGTKDQRRHPRIKVRWPVSIRTDHHPTEGETRNITEAGMLICTKDPLKLNASYRICLFPPNHPPLEFGCTVVWSDLYGIDAQDTVYGVGFCFVKVSDEDLGRLREVIPSPDAGID